MSSNLAMDGQTTKKYNLPLSHLEYSYIEKCSNIKELEKILRVLRSGDEGKYPDLELFTEKRIEALDPKSRVLRKEGPILRPGDLSSGDWKTIEEDLKSWSTSMHDRDSAAVKKLSKGVNDIVEVDENLPPVRSTNVVLEGNKQKTAASEKKKKKRVMPRDYKEWDKVNIDEELEKVDQEDKPTASKKSSLNGVSLEIDTTGMTEEEKEMKAVREKDKGNEAFRSHDYEESVTYYSRSISLLPTAASYNNRALAYLKLEQWDKAVSDCNTVLKTEKDNIKALLRRGTAFKSKKDYKKAVSDFEKVLQLEPQNKKAEGLLEEVNKEIQKQEKEKKEKGRRMVIEEVEESSEDEEMETIEVEKPVINGHTNAPVTNGKKNDNKNVSEVEKQPPSEKHIKSTVNKSPEAEQVDSPSKENKRSDYIEEKAPSASPSEKAADLCSSSPSAIVPSVKEETVPNPSALSSTESGHSVSSSSTSVSSSSSTPTSTTDQSPKPSFSLGEESNSDSMDNATAPCLTSDTSPTPFQRPIFLQLPLNPEVLKLKEAGNNLFRSGQYGEAIGEYSKAITILQKDKCQIVNTSLLLSNRAACHLKTGHCSEAVQDCSAALTLVPHSLKALLRRAAAYETLEKYGHAYVDYKHVLSVDSSALQAQQGASRCQNMLQQIHGPRQWREKIPPLVHVKPWEVPDIVDPAGLHKSMSSSVSLVEQASSTTPEVKPSQEEPTLTPQKSLSSTTSTTISTPTTTKETVTTAPKDTAQQAKADTVPAAAPAPAAPSFEELKSRGNQHVQKGNFKEAAACYSECITQCPDQVACYTNRALCYLKLNKPSDAESDCDKALSLQSTNPKALYRRALARKMQQQYKQSLQDLLDLLRVEPKNTAAKKEIEEVKKSYKEELDKLKVKKAEQESKVRKRMKIEEVEDDEEEEKPARSKLSEKSKLSGKSRGAKSTQQAGGVKSKAAEKKVTDTSVHSPPVAPPIAPRLMKTTPYEFCQAWNSLKPCQGIQPYSEILRQITPADLPQVISNKLDGQMLQIIVRCVYEEMVMKGDVDQGYHILDSLCQVPRFSTVSMFMSSKEKKEVAGVLDILGKNTSSAYNSADILRLKKEYSVK